MQKYQTKKTQWSRYRADLCGVKPPRICQKMKRVLNEIDSYFLFVFLCLYTLEENADTKSDRHILVLDGNRKKRKLVFKDLA